MLYRKKPIVVEAYRHFGERPCIIHTLEGSMRANPGDYIIIGIKGEQYPCKPDIFEATYENWDVERSLEPSVAVSELQKLVDTCHRHPPKNSEQVKSWILTDDLKKLIASSVAVAEKKN